VEGGVPFVKEMIVHVEPTTPHDERVAQGKRPAN
jgi:hypothetical protein